MKQTNNPKKTLTLNKVKIAILTPKDLNRTADAKKQFNSAQCSVYCTPTSSI